MSVRRRPAGHGGPCPRRGPVAALVARIAATFRPRGGERWTRIDRVFEKVVNHVAAERKACPYCGQQTRGHSRPIPPVAGVFCRNDLFYRVLCGADDRRERGIWLQPPPAAKGFASGHRKTTEPRDSSLVGTIPSCGRARAKIALLGGFASRCSLIKRWTVIKYLEMQTRIHALASVDHSVQDVKLLDISRG